jgi:hypothetical protein
MPFQSPPMRVPGPPGGFPPPKTPSKHEPGEPRPPSVLASALPAIAILLPGARLVLARDLLARSRNRAGWLPGRPGAAGSVQGPGRRPAGIGITLAGIVLTVASCTSHPTAVPQIRHLGSPIVLEAVLSQPGTPAGGCPAGLVALSGPGAGPGQCYRQLGTPVTITSAAVSSYQVSAGRPGYGLLITVPSADVAALTAITTKAYDSGGDVDVSVAGKTWEIPEALKPITTGRFAIVLQSKNQARQLQRILVPPA